MHSPTHLYNWNAPTCWCCLVVLLELVLHYLTLLRQAFTARIVTKARTIQFIDCSVIKKRNSCKTSLSDYYACLWRDLLLMASGADTHIHTHTHTRKHTDVHGINNFKKPGTHGRRPRAPGLKIVSFYACMYVQYNGYTRFRSICVNSSNSLICTQITQGFG